MSIPKGTRFGRYEIRALLGSGGVGEVYLAEDLNLHRRVALKVLRTDLAVNKARLQRFQREAFAVSTLNHPNIVSVYEIGHENEYHFLVTEFVDGESLSQHLRHEPFKLLEALEIGIQIASAIAAAHAAGIVHRDIKPENIMLRRDHLVKVLDFGLAKLNEPDVLVNTETQIQGLPLTLPGVVMGTPNYMSPEQARGLPVDVRSDIWSLGVVLYEMVSGDLPFSGKTASDVIAAILQAHPRGLTKYDRKVPAELERIVFTALRKDQEERYQMVKDLGLDLKSLKQHLEFEAELERSGSPNRTKAESGAEAISARSLNERQTAETIVVAGTSTDREVSHIHATSSAEYIVTEIKRHPRGIFVILATLLALVTGVAYFAYSRYSARSGKADISSIAVLPLTNTSNDPEKEYLSDGISESLINRLSQLPGVKVIARSSSFKFKGQDANPLEVARALNVTGIISGRVTQTGDNLVISVELMDGRDRTHVWGEQYNRKVTDLLALQADISREIAEALRVRLTAGQQRQVVARETANPEANDLLLKGYLHRARGTTEDRRKAADYFNQAIAVDPKYALAYAELSDIYRSLTGASVLDPKEYIPKATAAAQKALELNEGLAEAHYALANMRTFAWEWEDAEREYKRAIELNPNLALAHRWYGNYLGVMNRHEEAIAEIKRSRELDPLSLSANASVGNALYAARRYDEAIQTLKTALEMDPSYPGFYGYLGYAYAGKGMYADAISAYQQAIRLGSDGPSVQIFLGAAYALSGDRERARAILKRLKNGKAYYSPGELAILYGALGDREGAFAALEEAYEAHDLQLQSLGIGPEYDPLRSDPRFHDLVRRVGLAK